MGENEGRIGVIHLSRCPNLYHYGFHAHLETLLDGLSLQDCTLAAGEADCVSPYISRIETDLREILNLSHHDLDTFDAKILLGKQKYSNIS